MIPVITMTRAALAALYPPRHSGRRNIRLPRPRLVPLCLKTPAVRRFLAETYEALSAQDKARADRFHAICDARMRRERSWRVMNQRRRLYACYWAGWRPAWLRKFRGLLTTTPEQRHGSEGRKWLLSHRPRIRTAHATSTKPGR